MRSKSRTPVTVGCTLAILTAAALSGCSLGDDVIAGMGDQQQSAHGQMAAPTPGPGGRGAPSNALVVTPQQHDFLAELRAAGVRPSSDLNALSIGSYVCQAHAARQTEDAVWEFVAPLVRNDMADDDTADGEKADGDTAHDNTAHDDVAHAPPAPGARAAGADAATADYIRIATDRLC